MSNGRTFDVETLGVLTPKPVEVEQLSAGEVGFLTATIKTVADCKIGDTITDDHHPAIEPLPGFEELKPMVFAGLYTVDAHEHTLLREALEKLRLNDASFFFEPESSAALGFGFRCAFSACCTWRSSRSGWSANTTSPSSPPRPACVTKSR